RAEDEAERVPDERALLLQHRAAGGRGHVPNGHRIPRRRRLDVRLRLSALGMPVPGLCRQCYGLDEPRPREAREIVLGQRDAPFPAELSDARGMAGAWRPPYTGIS